MAPAAERWKVEYQTETVGLGSDGRPVEGVKVGFVTSGGVHGSVFVAKANYNANAVKAAIHEQVEHIEAIHKLTG